MKGIDRVLTFCRTQKETLTEFYEKTQLTEARITAIRNRKSGIPEEVLMAIKKTYPTLDINWVLTGEGEMLLRDSAGSIQQINNGVMGNSAQVVSIETCRGELAQARTEIEYLKKLLNEKDFIIQLLNNQKR